MYQCNQCGEEQEVNWCPTCSQTIDRCNIEEDQKAQQFENKRKRTKPPKPSPQEQFFSRSLPEDNLSAQIEEAKGKLHRKLILGLCLAGVGLLISIVSFESAKNAGGGQYVVTYGLVLAGVLRIITALIGLAKTGNIEKSIEVKKTDQPKKTRFQMRNRKR